METDKVYLVVGRLWDLYVSNYSKYVQMFDKGIMCTAKKGPRVKGVKRPDAPLKMGVLHAHINHAMTVCVFASPHGSKFICFDVDDGNVGTVRTVLDKLGVLGFDGDRIYVSSSGGKGFHVEMFFDKEVPTANLRRIYDYVCDTGSLDKGKVEFRPTFGMAIKLPLGRHFRSGNVCWFLDKETMEPIEDLCYVFQIERQEQDSLESALSVCSVRNSCEGVKGEQVQVLAKDEGLVIRDGEEFPDIQREGQRHKLMSRYVARNRKQGMDKDENRRTVEEWYHRQDPSVISSAEEMVMADLDSLIGWAYGPNFSTEIKPREICFEEADYRLLLAQPTKLRRILMFLVCYHDKKYGKLRYSAKDLGEMVGFSARSVQAALTQMRDGEKGEGWISYSNGKCTEIMGGYAQEPNSYWVTEEAKSWSVIGKESHLPNMQWGRTSKVFKVKLNKPIWVDSEMCVSEEGVRREYFKVMLGMADTWRLSKVLTKTEIEELLSYAVELRKKSV